MISKILKILYKLKNLCIFFIFLKFLSPNYFDNFLIIIIYFNIIFNDFEYFINVNIFIK